MRSLKNLSVLASSMMAFGAIACGQPSAEDADSQLADDPRAVAGHRDDATPTTAERSPSDALGTPESPPPSAWTTLGAWGGYSNGKIPLAALTKVDYPGIQLDVFPNSLANLYLQPSAAVAMLAMMKEYNRQTGGYLHPNEGYRTYEGQVYWKNYWTSQGKPGNAATPGTSNHGWGQAVDFNLTSAQSSWLATYASRYGYSRSSSEAWHYDFSGSYGGGGGTSSCGSLSTTSTESDGIPGSNYWKLFQCFAAKKGGYTGAIDGAPGYYTYSGFQRAAGGFGYAGPIDGTFSESGYSNGGLALQKVAAAYGYTGALDGVPGPNTYKRSAAYFNYLWLNHGLD